MRVRILVDGRAHEAVVDRKAGTVTVDGETFPLLADDVRLLRPGRAAVAGRALAYRIEGLDRSGEAAGAASAGAKVRPPMTGKLESVRVHVGQAVQKGDVLFVLEAMKMQNEVRAPMAGTVTAVHVQSGVTVETSQVLLEIEAPR